MLALPIGDKILDAMHEHLQHLDQDYQPAFEDEGAQQNNFNR